MGIFHTYVCLPEGNLISCTTCKGLYMRLGSNLTLLNGTSHVQLVNGGSKLLFVTGTFGDELPEVDAGMVDLA